METANSKNNDLYEEIAAIDPSDRITIEEIVQKNISKHIRSLSGFLSSGQFITEKGDQKTNIINVSEKKTYNVPTPHLEEFFTILDQCRQESRMIHFSERQETSEYGYSGIMIDFDIYQPIAEPQLKRAHFDALTRYVCRILREVLDFEEHASGGCLTFHIFYIRKPAVVPDKTVFKDGFHVLIPELQVLKGLKRYLLDELIKRGNIRALFKDILLSCDPDKVLDKMSASNPVHFFGNSKPGKPAYPLTMAYEVTIFADEEDIDKTPLDVSILLDGKALVDGVAIPINLMYELSLAANMTTFGGNRTWLKKRNIKYHSHFESRIQSIVEKSANEIFSDEDMRRDEEDLSIVNINNPQAKYLYDLVKILDIEYASTYDQWFKVICAIAHTGTTEDYKLIACEFSKRRPQDWSASEFERVWGEATQKKYDRRPVTIRSLQYWARLSSQEVYDEIKKNHYSNILRRAVYSDEGRVEHATVARLVHAMCSDKFVVDVGINDKTNRGGYCWWEFVTPGQAMRKGEIFKWRKEMEPDNVHLFIADHLPKVYRQVRDSLKERKDAASNEIESKYWQNVEKNFKMYQSKLGNDTFQNGVIKQCHYKFRQRGFSEELDSYEDIIGVGNGVLKIGADPVLIKGFHEYKISKFTETDYTPYDPQDPYILELMSAFQDIFPEKDVLDYMLYHAATGLDAKESACILTLLVGGGRNGKSFFAKMIHNTLGHTYCASGKPSVITGGFERAAEANSAQMQQKDKRWYYLEEFNNCETLNTAKVKSMVTPTWQSGRDLHTKQCNFKNTSNVICFSNFDFIIETSDHGTWRRIYYYRNKVKFCDEPNPNNPFEKKNDNKFIDVYTNDHRYQQAMLSIMVHYYSKLCRIYGGDLKRVKSPTIARETEEFRNRQDALNKFITQMIVKSPNGDSIALSTIAGKYAEWYSRNIKNIYQPISEVLARFENSQIADHLEHRLNGTKYLLHHRMKDYIDEPLRDGEEELTTRAAVSSNTTVPVDNHVEVFREKEFGSDLSRTAPVYIQRPESESILTDSELLSLCEDIII